MCFFDQYTLNKCLFPSRAEWSAHDNNEHTQVLQIPFIYQEIYKWLQCKRQDASSSLRSYLSWIFFSGNIAESFSLNKWFFARRVIRELE